MPNRLTAPIFRRGYTHSGHPALLLTIGAPEQWPVLISPADFDLVTQTTGYHAWGIQGRNAVVGDPDRACGQRAVVKIIAGITDSKMRAVFRDKNPLNLMRENIGIQGRGGVFWLELRPGETDPVHFAGAFPNKTPGAILRHRCTVRPPRDPAQAGLPNERQHWTQRGA